MSIIMNPGKNGPKFDKTTIIKQRVLEAWRGGDRSFDEVMKITGYSARQVGYYLDRNACKGITKNVHNRKR